MKRILFSPIGGTDPISNCYDGAMLHICRVYNPDIVYLYLSKEMCEYQRKGQRYTKVLEWLGEKIGKKIEVILIEDPEMKEVQIFDAFIDVFEKKINCIYNKYSEEVELLLNVSSGTPAMKSSLQILSFIYSKSIPIQVSIPTKRISNFHEDKDNYDVKLQWECDDDNREDFNNRCIQSRAAVLQDRLIKDNIIKFIDKYDYQAAELMMGTMFEKPKKEFIDLLKVAHYRSMINIKEIKKIYSKLPAQLFPIQTDNEINVFEYILYLFLKYKKGEYADFVRGITPISTELMKRVMEKKCNIKVSDFAILQKNDSYKLSEKKIKENPIINEAFLKEFENTPKEVDVTSAQYKAIIYWTSSDEEIKQLVTDVRNVERNVRNLAAHQIVSITDEFIQKHTEFTVEQIVKKIKKLTVYAGINIKQEAWSAYELMNEKLKQMLI